MSEVHKARNEGRRFRITFILLSAGYILLGLMRLLYKDTQGPAICYLLGGLALVGGLVRLAFYFMRKRVRHIFRNDLAVGTILLAAGLYCFFKPDTVLELLPTLLGFAVLFDSVLKMEYALDSRRLGSRLWAVLMLLSLVSALCSILLVLGSFKGNVLFYFFGCVLLYDGLVNLFALAVLMTALRRFGKNPAVAAVAGGAQRASGAKNAGTAGILSKMEDGEAPDKTTPNTVISPVMSQEIPKPVRGPSSSSIEEEPADKE